MVPYFLPLKGKKCLGDQYISILASQLAKRSRISSVKKRRTTGFSNHVKMARDFSSVIESSKPCKDH